MFERGFGTQGWLTYKQAQALGGNVRKGETGTTICYADRFTPRQERDKPIAEASDEHRRQVAFLKRFTVFNVDQCEGVPDALSVGGGAFLGERETIECAEALMAATGAQIGIGGDKAFYMPTADRIQLPPQQTFHDQVNYYRTALHELGHNAATRIMPHGLVRRLVFRASVVRRFGIIRAFPRTRGADHLAGSGLTVSAERRRERGLSPSSAYRRGCRSGWSRRSRDQARARSPLDQHRGGAGPSRCCGVAYAV